MVSAKGKGEKKNIMMKMIKSLFIVVWNGEKPILHSISETPYGAKASFDGHEYKSWEKTEQDGAEVIELISHIDAIEFAAQQALFR